MPRPRTPTNVLDLRGSFNKHPERKRKGEPVPEGNLGECPSRLEGLEREAWSELVEQVPAGVLTSADRWSAELTCKLMAKIWKGENTGADMGHLIKLLSQLGMTPADRSKISLEPKKPANEFEEFK